MDDKLSRRKILGEGRSREEVGRSEFMSGPWFPLVCVLLVVTVVVIAMLFAGFASGVPATLAALATVVSAVGGLIVAARFRKN
jgi:hypothetical protein